MHWSCASLYSPWLMMLSQAESSYCIKPYSSSSKWPPASCFRASCFPASCFPASCSPASCSPASCFPASCSPASCFPASCFSASCSPASCSSASCFPASCFPTSCSPASCSSSCCRWVPGASLVRNGSHSSLSRSLTICTRLYHLETIVGAAPKVCFYLGCHAGGRTTKDVP